MHVSSVKSTTSALQVASESINFKRKLKLKNKIWNCTKRLNFTVKTCVALCFYLGIHGAELLQWPCKPNRIQSYHVSQLNKLELHFFALVSSSSQSQSCRSRFFDKHFFMTTSVVQSGVVTYNWIPGKFTGGVKSRMSGTTKAI